MHLSDQLRHAAANMLDLGGEVMAASALGTLAAAWWVAGPYRRPPTRLTLVPDLEPSPTATTSGHAAR